MTSVASGSPDFSNSSNNHGDTTDKEAVPQRPKLVSPPRRPQRPLSPEPAPAINPQSFKSSEPPSDPQPEPEPGSRLQPITPPSEPMQYRAIGTVRGVYTPDEEDQFNRGQLATDDGHTIEAVLLGRITSLVKNHIDLSLSHLWVVYPRTRQSEKDGSPELHLQIVGVWEPETLGLPGEESGGGAAQDTAAEADSEGDAVDAPQDQSSDAAISLDQMPEVDDNYFSIRGEILKYEEEEQLISVKILQNPRKGTTTRKAFRLTIKGELSGRTVGYFWNLDVRREGSILALVQGNPIGIVPPKKKRAKGGKSPGPRRGSFDRRPGGSNRPRPRRSEDENKEVSKVVIKRTDRDH